MLKFSNSKLFEIVLKSKASSSKIKIKLIRNYLLNLMILLKKNVLNKELPEKVFDIIRKFSNLKLFEFVSK